MHRYTRSVQSPVVALWTGVAAFLVASVLAPLSSGGQLRAAEMDASGAARRVDRLLAKELPAESQTASVSQAPPDLKSADVGNAQVDDETFLRRVSFDLIGVLPTPEEITQFVFDARRDKRAQLVDRLLADERFGENWARYWRDAVLYRRSDDRALLTSESVTRYLTVEFNKGTGWDEIARSFIAAKGNLAQDGSTALIASQWGEVPETAAEVSRVLLGVQIQCAQCHDHPTDRWKREQFHELSAFFARIAVRAIRVDGARKGFEVAATDERLKDLPPKAQAKLKAQAKGKNRRFEHFMPDLQDPSAQGQLMEPVLFLTGQKLASGESDEERRATLGDWITSPDNPWFAKAFVNRVWGELVGVGFYEPIDDLGPDRPCAAPETLDFLCAQFIERDFDIKWLYRTIVATQAYGAPTRPRSPNGDNVPTTACVQPLRSDQLFSALTAALEIDEQQMPTIDRSKAYNRGPRSARAAFQQVFGFDPSTPRDELTASIPQALLMMNQTGINRALSAGGDSPGRSGETMLGRLLASTPSDEDVVVELYLRCVAREPKANELKTCLEYVAEVGNRGEAFEDVLWSLVNSTEFLYRQ